MPFKLLKVLVAFFLCFSPCSFCSSLITENACLLFIIAFSHDRRFLGSISHDQMLKLWDLNEILQGSENAAKGQDASSDSDSDGMDVDDNPSHSKKGTKTKNANKGGAGFSGSNNFFADL